MTTLTLYHNPRSRSASARVLPEALGVPYEVKPLDFTTGQTRTPEFLATVPESHTGRFLAKMLEPAEKAPAKAKPKASSKKKSA